MTHYCDYCWISVRALQLYLVLPGHLQGAASIIKKLPIERTYDICTVRGRVVVKAL
jgi:hypothetical protein